MSGRFDIKEVAAQVFKWWKNLEAKTDRNYHLFRYGIVSHGHGEFELVDGAQPSVCLNVLFDQLERNGFSNQGNAPPNRTYENPLRIPVNGASIQALPANGVEMVTYINGWTYERSDGKKKICVIVSSPYSKPRDLRQVQLTAIEFTGGPVVTDVRTAAQALFEEFMVSHENPGVRNRASYFVELIGPYGSPPPRKSRLRTLLGRDNRPAA